MVWRINAEPSTYQCQEQSTALIIVDMQRDFLEPGGFGEMLGNDVSRLEPVIAVCKELLEVARESKLTIVHTREGHLPDLSDLPETKRNRGKPGQQVGDLGPLGRILFADPLVTVFYQSWNLSNRSMSSTNPVRAHSLLLTCRKS